MSTIESCNPNSQKIIILTELQKEKILDSQNEYLNGNYFDNDSINEEFEKWLQE